MNKTNDTPIERVVNSPPVPGTLRFNVGPFRVTVELSTSRMYDDAGDELLGRCDFNKRLVLLSPACPAQQRRAVILHELRHAWCFYCGRPNGDEADADHYALMTDSILADLEAQGGIEALDSLGKLETGLPPAVYVNDRRYRVEVYSPADEHPRSALRDGPTMIMRMVVDPFDAAIYIPTTIGPHGLADELAAAIADIEAHDLKCGRVPA